MSGFHEFEFVDDVFLNAKGSEPFDPTRFKEMLTTLKAGASRCRGMLAYAAGGTLSTEQRNRLTPVFAKWGFPIAVVTGQRTTRGSVIAVSWHAHIKIKPCDTAEMAFSFCDVTSPVVKERFLTLMNDAERAELDAE